MLLVLGLSVPGLASAFLWQGIVFAGGPPNCRPDWACSPARLGSNALTLQCRFDRSNVDLAHLHHRFERALGRRPIRAGIGGRQYAGRDLPRQAPFVLAPAAFAFLAAVTDDRVPQAVRLGLVVGCDLERECLAMFERRSPI